MTTNEKGYDRPELLITPDGLAEKLGVSVGSASRNAKSSDSQSPAIIDLRAAERFTVGHIPGAVHLDLFGLSLIDTDPAPLKAFLWMIGHLLMSRGVDTERSVVVYDDVSGIRAARAFWFLEFFGHPSVQLLDGGVGRWERAGYFTTTETIKPMQKDWKIVQDDTKVATWLDVNTRLGNPETVVLDTRSDGEYCGTTVRAKRGGAVPGAVHLEWTNNLEKDGTFKSANDLRRMYEGLGVTRQKEIISYCQGGYRAAHSYLALRLLGYGRVRNYVGSWKEWGDREDLPIEIPTKV